MIDKNPSPTLDSAFRQLYGNERNRTKLTMPLVQSIVGPSVHLVDLVIKNPINLATYEGSKESILDIKAKDQNGNWYGIEMQNHEHVFYGKRAIFGLSKLCADQLGSGMAFARLNTSIGIHFLNFNYFKDDRMVRQVVLKDMETDEYHEQLSFLQLFFVELPKLREDWQEESTPLERVVAFLRFGENLHSNDMPAALRSDPVIVRSVEELERMRSDPRMREIYEAEEKRRMIDEIQLKTAEERGIHLGRQEGEQEGRQKGKEELLSFLLQKRFSTLPPDITVRLDRLTPEQMNELGLALFQFTSLSELENWLSSR